MPCYVIQAFGTDMVKVGWARGVEKRLQELQCAHYERLIVIREIDCEAWFERTMHEQFAEYRVRGEWFHFHPEMLVYSPTKYDQGSHETNTSNFLRRFCVAFGSQWAFARALGITQTTVSAWIIKGAVPAVRIAQIVEMGAKLDPPIILQPNDFFTNPSQAAA